MNERESDILFYAGGGSILAVLLGITLIPLRELTTASNLTFLFLALIILVAELGGRWPAFVTAVSSALSVNFFLTQPYLTLDIDSRDDLLGVAGLAICGLIAASFGARGRRMRAFAAAREELDLLHAASRELESAGPVETRLAGLLDGARKVFPLTAAAVRDRQGRVLAATDRGQTLSAAVAELDLRSQDPLPSGGARLALVSANTQVGSLDVWGNGARVSSSTKRALAAFAGLLAALVASETRL
jgi:two-component system sensor histidine kinase KdpD